VRLTNGVCEKTSEDMFCHFYSNAQSGTDRQRERE